MRLRLVAFAMLLSVSLWAADFWEAKPFTEWSDKDLQKMISSSPWARRVEAPMSGGQTKGGGRGKESDTGDSGGGGGRQKGAARADNLSSISNPDLDQAPQGAPTVAAMVRWITALPMKQAQMRGKYGKEAGTSPEAQKFLSQESTFYVISVGGLPGSAVGGRAGDQAKDQIRMQTTLTLKGKDPIHPAAIELTANGNAVDVLLGFPRSVPIALEDQEMEFASRLGTITVKTKFKLKDMVYHGKLEL